MNRRLLFAASVSFALALPASSQISTSVQMGKPDKPIAGSPFTADQTVHITRHLPDGILVARDMHGHICRSADGVERYEGTFPSTDTAHPGSATMVYILDRVKHTSILLNSTLKTATRSVLPDPATVSVAFLPLPQPAGSDRQIKPENLTPTDLGKRTFELIEIHGTLITASIPAGKVGNDQPLPVTIETWYAPQQKVIVKQIEKNPLTGERTYELSNIRSEEPDPALFQIPEGYTVKDASPLPTGKVSQGTQPAGMPPTLVAPPAPPLPDPMSAEIEQAKNSPNAGVKDALAYKLANLNADIPQAKSLAEEAVAIEEKQLADFGQLPASPDAFAQMIVLSRFWNTMGLIYYRENNLALAESYTRAAWELDPKAFVGNHLGRILQQQHRPEEAKAAYLMAISLPASDAERQQIQFRLAELGVTTSIQPQKAAITAPLPSLGASIAPSGNGPVVDILLSHDSPTVVSILRGDPALKEPVTRAIQSALTSALPDAGPEKVVRRARITCDAKTVPACTLNFFSSREAQSPDSTVEALTPLL
jgi:hypothetical protein